MKILKIILLVLALNYSGFSFAAVNGKWVNTGNSIYNLNLYSEIIPVCESDPTDGLGAYIWLRKYDVLNSITIDFVADEDCRDFYKGLVDFIDSSNSYWSW